jgi:NADPH:quinone reductase-like Zn-dependent oxidoreductase
MKAIVYTEYGTPEVLRLKDIEQPTPRDDEVSVKVHAASVNSFDWRLLNADPFLVRLMGGGLLRPKNKILEYVCAREDALVSKPAGVTFEEAAALPMAAVTALKGLRDKGQIKPGQRVLINGASGGVGTFAVQIAKSFGAEVTAVCSTGKSDLARSIGADRVIDYTQEDFTMNGQQYDLILAANGYHPILDYKRALSPRGIYVTSGGSMIQMFQAILLGPWISMTGRKKLCALSAKPDTKDLTFMTELLEAGRVRPVIDRRYPLSKVSDALQYLGEGHARGKVVITLEDNDKT